MNELKEMGRLIERAQIIFHSHIADFSSQQGLQILDYRENGNGSNGALRVVFDNLKGGRVYISGDIGEAVVYPTCDATIQGMAECFTRRTKTGEIDVNPQYFLEKVKASSDRYIWTPENFKEDFRKEVEEINDATAMLIDPFDINDFFDSYLDWPGKGIEINTDEGIVVTDGGVYDALERLDTEYWEWFYNCGKRISPRVIYWLVGMRLAYEELKSKGVI